MKKEVLLDARLFFQTTFLAIHLYEACTCIKADVFFWRVLEEA